MYAGQVRALAQEWVEAYRSRTPGFCGAHLMGGILFLPEDSVFPATDDVDFKLILASTQEEEAHDITYKGLLLEYGTIGIEHYRSPEAVLSNPELASNLAADSLLSDPVGLLRPLHAVVKQEYSKRRWVKARCSYEKQQVTHALEDLSQALSPAQALLPLIRVLVYLAGLLMVADLRPPTHRRALVVMREILSQQGQAALHEEALGLLGSAHLTRAQVQAYLQDAATTFDRAVEITRTVVPFGFKLHPYVRPYLVDGLEELIQRGNHREVMLWVTFALWLANTAIQLDAPHTEKPLYQARLDRLCQQTGLTTTADITTRLQAARQLARSMFTVADEMVEHRPPDKEPTGAQ